MIVTPITPTLLPGGGTVTANAYVVAFEDLDTGEDFQDGVYLIFNVKPA